MKHAKLKYQSILFSLRADKHSVGCFDWLWPGYGLVFNPWRVNPLYMYYETHVLVALSQIFDTYFFTHVLVTQQEKGSALPSVDPHDPSIPLDA